MVDLLVIGAVFLQLLIALGVVIALVAKKIAWGTAMALAVLVTALPYITWYFTQTFLDVDVADFYRMYWFMPIVFAAVSCITVIALHFVSSRPHTR